MNRHPWTAFYWQDYLTDTAELTFEQHGAYLMLLAHYYSTGEPISAIACRLHKACRCTTDADKAAVQYVLDHFFELDGDVYRHGRVDQEIEKRRDISKKRSDAANQKYANGNAKLPAKRMQLDVHLDTQSQPQIKSKPPLPPFQKGGNRAKSKLDKELRRLYKASCGNFVSEDPAPEGRVNDRIIFECACQNLGIPIEYGRTLSA